VKKGNTHDKNDHIHNSALCLTKNLEYKENWKKGIIKRNYRQKNFHFLFWNRTPHPLSTRTPKIPNPIIIIYHHPSNSLGRSNAVAIRIPNCETRYPFVVKSGRNTAFYQTQVQSHRKI